MGSTLNSIGFALLLPTAIIVDITEVVLDFLAVGLIANRVIDIVMALCIALWLLLCGNFDGRPWTAVLVALIGEEIPIVDVAPLWTLDIVYIWLQNKKRFKPVPNKESNPRPALEGRISSNARGSASTTAAN